MPLKLPTPPTPPTIDKGEATESTPRIDAHQFFEVPFKRKTDDAIKIEPVEKPVEKPVEIPQKVERTVTTPEDMARDAVANGAGALTKKTVTRPNEETVSPAPATSTLPPATEKSNRGKEILREFQNEDRQISQTTETPRTFNRHQNESHGGFYWVVVLIFVGIISIVFVKKFLIRKNPPLKKSDLFEDADKRLQAVSEKVSAPKIHHAEKISVPNINPAEKISNKKPPPKNDDDKGKHFEVRI